MIFAIGKVGAAPRMYVELFTANVDIADIEMQLRDDEIYIIDPDERFASSEIEGSPPTNRLPCKIAVSGNDYILDYSTGEN